MSEEIPPLPATTTNFCMEYITLNSGTEIPPAFTAWCSLSAISCVLARRVWIDMGPFKIYPNMFIILIAGSGRMRKSTAINVTRDLLNQLSPKPNLVSQKLSPEFLLKKLSQTPLDPAKRINFKPTGQGFVITDELTNFLNRTTNDGGIVPMMIELYDCRELFSYGTLSRGEEILHDTQLGLLAATTPEELRKAIPEEVIGSGLASRILFVYETTPAPAVPFPSYNTRQLEAKEFCVRVLQRCSLLSGEIRLSEEARAWCRSCYVERCYNSKLLEDPLLRGYASRRYIHILKLAINLAVGLTESTAITTDILQRAEALVETNEYHLKKVIKLVTMNDQGSTIEYVLSIITRHSKIARQDLLKELSHRLNSRELVEIIDTLIKSNQVECVAQGASIYYIKKG